MIYVAKCEECGTFIKYGTQILMHDWSVIGPCCFEAVSYTHQTLPTSDLV